MGLNWLMEQAGHAKFRGNSLTGCDVRMTGTACDLSRQCTALCL